MNSQDQTGLTKSGKTYIVTEDLSYLVHRWCRLLEIDAPTNHFFKKILKDLVDILQDCFDKEGVEVKELQSDAFADLLEKKDIQSGKDVREFWVSLDDVYPMPREGCDSKYNISITRYITTDFEKPSEENKHGPRPEERKKDLSYQVRQCVNQISEIRNNNLNEISVVLIDDGTFDGFTIIDILNLFAEQKCFIESIRLGVAKEEGVKRIADWQTLDAHGNTHKVRFIGASKLCPPIEDWVCERDFFPGVLYAGKVVADPNDPNRPLLVGGKLKIPVRAQYLDGWGNMHDWASIPSSKARKFTREVLSLSVDLWEKLDELSLKKRRKRILTKDLPAIPFKIYDNVYSEMQKILNAPWLDILNKEHSKLKRNR